MCVFHNALNAIAAAPEASPESLSLRRSKPGEDGCEGAACIRNAEVNPPWWRKRNVGETMDDAGNHRSLMVEVEVVKFGRIH